MPPYLAKSWQQVCFMLNHMLVPVYYRQWNKGKERIEIIDNKNINNESLSMTLTPQSCVTGGEEWRLVLL